MNPSGGEGAPQPSFELPKQPESQPPTGEIASDGALERSSPSENAVGRQQPPPLPAVPQAPVVVPPADDHGQGTDDAVAAVADNYLPAAKDADTIEKIWIQRAKSVIAQTQDDPFIQKNEMSKVKADYIKQRYNKSIPTDDTVKA